MKKFLLFLLLALFIFPTNAFAGYVNGYYRSNGTYVNGYYRSEADGNPYNNYSFPGNTNPYTGVTAGGNASTYLNNYYSGSSGSSYSPSYTYPTTPTCPSNSYYDGVSSCKCNSGYVVGTDVLGKESCVSASSKCISLLGYGSQYNSLSNTCECSYGYLNDGGKCVSTTSYCTKSLGLMSSYNSLSKQCECMSGYEFTGSSCTYKKSTYSYTSSYPSSVNTCPLNSHESSSDSTKCQCDSGYETNITKTACVLSIIKTSEKPTSSPSISSENLQKQMEALMAQINALNGQLKNKATSTQVVATPIVTGKTATVAFKRNLSFGMLGDDVTELQKRLGISLPTGYFGNATQKALAQYQKDNNIYPASGYFGALTRAILNSTTAQTSQ